MSKVPFTTKEKLEEIIKEIPTPFHIYDEKGIRETARKLYDAFSWNKGFREYFAVKATPNPYLMEILKEEGCGFDCSSYTELMLSDKVGAKQHDIMFSSNATPDEDFKLAYKLGAIINLDDFTHIDVLDKLTGIPETICCRYNPGGEFKTSEKGNVMDTPKDAKYGMTHEQIISIFISSPDALKNIENQRDLLILLCVAMILFVFVRTCLQFLAKTLYEIVSQGVLQKVRNELFERIQNQDMHFFDTHTKGDLVTRLTGDLDMIRHSIAWIIMMVVESSALFLFTVIYFFTLDWLMTLFILALTPILFIVTRMFSKRVGPKYVVLREKLSRLNTKAQENIAANRVVKAFAREEYEKEDFDKYNRDYCEHNQQAAMVWLTFQPYIETLAQALWAVQMLVGGIFVINGRITIAQYTAPPVRS